MLARCAILAIMDKQPIETPTSRLTQITTISKTSATRAAQEAARHGKRLGEHSKSYGGVFWACFLAQGAYALLTALATAMGLVVAMTMLSDPGGKSLTQTAWEFISGDGLTGAFPLRYLLMGLVAIGALGLVGSFVVPMFIRLAVRVICNARVGYAWAMFANLTSWIVVTAMSTLLWLIPGAQPLVAFGVWLGSSALCAALIRGKLQPQVPASEVVTEP